MHPTPAVAILLFLLWVLGDLGKCSSLVHEEQTSAHGAFPSHETLTQQLVNVKNHPTLLAFWLFLSFRTTVTLDRAPSLCVVL